MQSSTSGTYGGSSFAARASAPTTSTLSSLLAKANALNEADHDPELPQIRFGMDEIERMSEVVAGRGKRAKTSAVDGCVQLNRLG